jgi:protein gp37
MAEISNIEWTEATWNCWHGCAKVSAGCKNCYMFTEKRAYGQDPERVVRSKTTFDAPLKWLKRHLTKGTPLPKYCFTCSWSDFFIAEADAWRPEAWQIIRDTPRITYQILTKRIERVRECLPPDWGNGYQNVWLGVSVENQDLADKRIPLLLDTPAVLRWISAEPLLGPLDLAHITGEDQFYNALRGTIHFRERREAIATPGLDWIVVGGESGHEARPCQLDWIRDIVAQCQAAKVPVFVKQLGAMAAKSGLVKLDDRKGGDPQEWPEDLRVREYPHVA